LVGGVVRKPHPWGSPVVGKAWSLGPPLGLLEMLNVKVTEIEPQLTTCF
jgi:hypothetical protein